MTHKQTRIAHARFNIAIHGVPALAVRQVDPDEPETARLIEAQIITLEEEPRPLKKARRSS